MKAALAVVTDETEKTSLEQGIEGWESALLQVMIAIKSNRPAKLGDLFPYEDNKDLLGLLVSPKELERADPLKKT